MAVRVTGGAGYIGSHTVLELKEQGEEVVILDNLRTGHRGALRDSTLYQGDLRDEGLLDRIFREQDIEAVIHFAACSLVGRAQRIRFPTMGTMWGGPSAWSRRWSNTG